MELAQLNTNALGVILEYCMDSSVDCNHMAPLDTEDTSMVNISKLDTKICD